MFLTLCITGSILFGLPALLYFVVVAVDYAYAQEAAQYRRAFEEPTANPNDAALAGFFLIGALTMGSLPWWAGL